MTKAGEVSRISALLVGVAGSRPATGGATEPDVGRIIIADVDVGWVGLLGEVLVGTLLVRGGLTIDLNLITTKEGCSPVSGAFLDWGTAADTDIGAGVVDGELTSGDGVRVVTAKVRPLEDVLAIRNPVRDFDGSTVADPGLATIKATETVARAGVALSLDGVHRVEQSILARGLDKVCHGLDERDLNETTIVIVPPPFERNQLATLEVVLVGNASSIISTRVLISAKVGKVLVQASGGNEHVGVGQSGRGSGDDKSELGEEHD